MTKKEVQQIVEAVTAHETTSWNVADVLVRVAGRVPTPGVFEEMQRKLREHGLDFKAATLKAYHQTAVAFPQDERRDASFSAHETARTEKRALDRAIEIFGPGPTVDEVRRVKANLKAGLAPDFVLPDLEAIELQAELARKAHEDAVAAGADQAELDRLFEESIESSRLLEDAKLASDQAADRKAKGDMKKVNDAYWLAKFLVNRATPAERTRLARLFRELADLYDGADGEREAAA